MNKLKKLNSSIKELPSTINLFIFLILAIGSMAIIYLFSLNPSQEKINKVVENFKLKDYSISDSAKNQQEVKKFKKHEEFNFSKQHSLLKQLYKNDSILEDYSIPEFVAKRYLNYHLMLNFYSFIYYTFNMVAISSTGIAIGYAAINKNEVNKKKLKQIKSSLIFFSTLSLLFTSFNMLVNPIRIADAAQHSWVQLEKIITSTVYDNNISNDDKNLIIVKKLAEIEEIMEIKIH